MSEQTYNGWKNRETWLVKLHLDNTEATQEDVLDLTEAARAQTEREPRFYLADSIREYAEEMVHVDEDEPGALLALDLVTTALARADFDEIAAAYLEDIDEIRPAK